MFDIVTVGGATQDFFLISSDYQVLNDRLTFVWGEKFVVDDLFVDVGGGACNSSVGFSRLGLNTALWCRIANDSPGKFILHRLANENIDTSFIDVCEGQSSSLSAIMVDKTGERSIVMFRGDNDNLDSQRVDFENIFNTRWLFVAELTGNPTPLLERISKEAAQRGVKFSFVPGLDQLDQGVGSLKNILSRTEILVFNDFEAGKFLGQGKSTRHSEGEVKEMLKKLSEYGVKISVITKDVNGVQAFDGDNFYSYPPPSVKNPVDTTGAGDAFASGFVAALVKGQSTEKALDLGTRNAGSVIQKIGAQTGLLKNNSISQ